ncbi:MAG: outer membrane lipoprotein carrier protein LolA [Gammaproteobacteria bacterium RIFCSPHIGHO2_12_FULL_41_20]|nr:MAG: outer membrane lipoprotein carrier protein LolA [Gammaproteobacteria bacterium RIFCSPHIGHO2_12_FULL_41_20]
MKLKQYIKILIVTSCLWCVFSLHANSAAEGLSQLFASIQTMQAHFTQTIFDNHGKAVQRSEGRMAFQRSGRFRWDVQRPIPQLIIVNGERLWIYDADLQQVVIRSLRQSAGEVPALLLSSSNTSLQADFRVREQKPKSTGGRANWRWFVLTPKEHDNMFEQIHVGFQQGEVRAMRLLDHLGHATFIEFQRIQLNTALSPTLFSFTPKKGVDVIDETRR